MAELKKKGTTSHLVDNMVTLQQCFELMGLSEMLATDESYSAEAVQSLP